MGSAKWWGVRDWYIDPAQTHGGDNDNDGLAAATPIQSIAEWRRRVRGAVFTGTGPVIHALSGSTNTDDGQFYGFYTPDLTTYVRLLGTPVTTGVSGTVASYQAYSGNTRGQFADAAVSSWAVSDATGSRWVRKVGTGVRHYAHLLKDLGAHAVQFGIVVDWDETDAVTIRQTETNFANGDAYEVVTLPSWPAIRASTGNVLVQCMDLIGSSAPSSRNGVDAGGVQFRPRLCGFPANLSISLPTGGIAYSCVVCSASPSGFTMSGTLTPINCSLNNTGIWQIQSGNIDWASTNNVIVGGELRFWHGMLAGSVGALRCFDCGASLISARHAVVVRLLGGIVGSGNSGPLITCDTGAVVYGASAITATTSAAHPYLINGVNHDSPAIETSGDAIYA